MSEEYKQPVYDERMTYILNELRKGKSREQVASELGYKNYKSMDMYCRRRNFRWNEEENMYTPVIDEEKEEISNIPTKAKLILSLLDKDFDVREVAERLDFDEHLQMARYMREHGFVWESEEENYVPEENGKDKLTVEGTDIGDNGNGDVNETEILKLGRYIPLMSFLENHREKLERIVRDFSYSVPPKRYYIKGEARTKTFYLSEQLSQLIKEYGRRTNISQREIVETALVEYLKRRSVEEVEAILE